MRSIDKKFGDKVFQKIATWQIEKWKSTRKEEVKPTILNCELALVKHMYSK
jgi:hypothetical protein